MKRKLLIIFSIIAILLMLYCIGAYIYLQQSLVPSLAEPTALMQTIGNICFPALLIVGLYHIVFTGQKAEITDRQIPGCGVCGDDCFIRHYTALGFDLSNGYRQGIPSV